MKKAKWIISAFFALALVALFFGCGANEQPSTPEQGQPAQKVDEAEEVFTGLTVSPSDTIIMNFTVVAPSHLYLNGPKPVKINVPGNMPFVFDKAEYFVTKPVFPMKIKIDIPRSGPFGKQKIPLALQLMYCNKADDICLIKNEILPVEFMVVKEGAGFPKTHTLEKIHQIK